MTVMPAPVRSTAHRRGLDATAVMSELERLHGTLRAGEPFPSQRELMGRLDASERIVRGALDELHRQGKIIRRLGRGGSVVAERPEPNAHHVNGAAHPTRHSAARHLEQRSILAICEPDAGIFDQAMRTLASQAKSFQAVVHCQFMWSGEADRFAVPPLGDEPLSFVLFRRQFLPLAERLHAAGHRVVFVGTPYADASPEVSSVHGDQEHGGYLAAKHLLELGHRRIGFHFTGDFHCLRRWVGCRRAMEDFRGGGLEISHEILDLGMAEVWKHQPQLVRSYFARADAPTCMVAWNDTEAVRLLTLLLNSGIRVPEDVSLIGYDNLDMGAEIHPSLSTVDGVLETQIQSALRLLTQPKAGLHHVVVTPTLVPRQSTAPPRR